MEAGWLAALVVVPLYFSPFSDRAFEPAKAGIVRILAGAMCAAWLVGWLTSRRSPDRRFARGNLLALPVLVLLAANALSTIASISPATSLVGAYERSQGLYATAAWVAIFFLVAAGMRSLRHVERAITAALTASLTVALYGVLQRHGLDPLPPDPAFFGAVGSTLGNPGFLGGYLAMTAPLALMRLLSVAEAAGNHGDRGRALVYGAAAASTAALVLAFAASGVAAVCGAALVLTAWAWIGREAGRGVPFSLTGFYAFVLAAQVSALLASETRGPALGLLGGLCVFVVLHALLRARARLVAGVLVAAALVLGVLVVLDATASRIDNGGMNVNSTADVREQIWEAGVRLALPHDPLWSGSDGADRLNALRPLVGHGPDSFAAASAQVLPPELGRLQGRTVRVDHAHNETLDALVHTGVIGALAYLGVAGAILYLALASLGFAGSRGRRRFAVACAVGATLAAAIVTVSFGRMFVGLAIPAGIAAAAATWLARGRGRPTAGRATHRERLLIALTAALSAHLIETQTNIATTTVRTYFWIMAAALVVVSAGSSAAPAVVRPDGESESEPAADRRELTALLTVAAVATLVVATLAFGFLNATTLAEFPSDSTVAVLLLAAVGAAGAAAMSLVECSTADRRFGRARALGIVVAATTALLCAFLAPFLYAVDRGEDGDLSALAATVAVFASFLVALMVVLGAALGTGLRRPVAAAPTLRTAGAIAAAALLAGLSVWVNARIGQADIVHQQAPAVSLPGQLVGHFDAAVEKQPLHDRAQSLLADAHARRANIAPSRGLRARELRRAEQALLRARRLNPFEPEHTLELAVLHESAAGLGVSTDEARYHLARSARYYRQATRMSPTSPYVRNRRAHALLAHSSFLARRGDARGAARLRRSARRELRRAFALDPDYCLTSALRARAGTSWKAMVSDAFAGLDRRAGPCGGEGLERRVLSLVTRALVQARRYAERRGATAEFLERVRRELRTRRNRAAARAAAPALRARAGLGR